MTEHTAVTKLLRKEFNIKDDEALLQAFNNLPESYYQMTYFQKKAFIVDKITKLVSSINSDGKEIGYLDKDTRSGSMISGLRFGYNAIMETYKQNRKTLKTHVSLLIQNVSKAELKKLEYKEPKLK